MGCGLQKPAGIAIREEIIYDPGDRVTSVPPLIVRLRHHDKLKGGVSAVVKRQAESPDNRSQGPSHPSRTTQRHGERPGQNILPLKHKIPRRTMLDPAP